MKRLGVGAAWVCGHIAREGAPIGTGFRDPPVGAGDSGWHFLCQGGGEEPEGTQRPWSLPEVLAFEPSLQGLLESPVGTALVRDPQSPGQWLALQQGLP